MNAIIGLSHPAGWICANELQSEAVLLEIAIKKKSQRTILDERLSTVVACMATLITELETKLSLVIPLT